MEDILAVIYKQLPGSNLACVWEAVVRERTAVQLALRCNLHSDSMWLSVATMQSNTCCKYLPVVLQSFKTHLHHTVCIMLVYVQCKICLAKWKIICSGECVPKWNISCTSSKYICQTFFFSPWLPHTPLFFSTLTRNCISKPMHITVFCHDSICSTNMDLALLGCVMIPVNPEIPFFPQKQLESYVLTTSCSSDSVLRTRWPREAAKHNLCCRITKLQTMWEIQIKHFQESTNKLTHFFDANSLPRLYYGIAVALFVP